MSTFEVPVVPVVLDPHPNADSLSIVKVWGYECVVKTSDWVGKDIGAYICPDSVMPDKPEYAFLSGHLRIKARKFRGVWSQGFLVEAPPGSKVGDNVADYLGVTHYEPESKFNQCEALRGPTMRPPWHRDEYDMESFYRYPNLLEEGEYVCITEKIHGTNARFTYHSDTGEMMVGSHRTWKTVDGNSVWHKVLAANPWIEKLAKFGRGLTIYGEIYGDVQDLTYGLGKGEYEFAAFDLLLNGKYMDWNQAHNLVCAFSGRWVPVLYVGKYSEQVLRHYIDGDSYLAAHMREGVVIKPLGERKDHRHGRVILKAVSNAYLERSKGENRPKKALTEFLESSTIVEGQATEVPVGELVTV